MSDKLWFVNDGMEIIGVYTSKREAELDYQRFHDDADFDYYKFYCIDLVDLEDFPDEYEYALQQDYI